MGSIAYKSALNMAKTNVITTTIIGLEKTMKIINARFSEIRNMTNQIFMKQDLLYLSNKNSNLSTTDYYKLRRFSKELRQYSLTNSFIDDFTIYFPKVNTIVSPNYVYTNVSNIYGKLFKYNEKSFKEWEEDLNSSYNFTIWPSQNFTLHNRQKSVITYVAPKFAGYVVNPGNIVSVLIEENQIIEYLRGIDSSEMIDFFIVDNNGDIIVSEDHSKFSDIMVDIFNDDSGSIETTIGDTKYTFVYVRCPYYNLIYAAAISPEYFSEKASYVKEVFFLTGILAFILSFIYIVFTAFYNSKPIRTVMEILKDSAGFGHNNGTNDTKSIERTLSQIIRNNKEMRDKLSQQLPILRESVIRKLLLGEFYSENEIESALLYSDISMNSGSYVVVLMNIYGYNGKISPAILDEINMSRIIAENAIRTNFQNRLFFCNIDEDKMAIIICFASSKINGYKEYLQTNLQTVIDELKNHFNINVNFAIGEKCNCLMDISHSYIQAKTALESTFIKQGEKVIWYSDITNEITGYYYPMDIELRLMRLVKMGEEKEVLKLLEDIYEQNFSAGNLHNFEIKQLLYEMRGTLVKLCSDLAKGSEEQDEETIIDMLNVLDMSSSINEIYNSMRDLYKNLCRIINKRKKSNNAKLKIEIIEYIRENYTNPNLCLNDVASQFGLSEKYLSDFFKEQTGESFSSYVERLRMDHIIEMLKDENLSIASIAKMCGYNSTNTLYKVFKRKFGVSPRTYREMCNSFENPNIAH